MSLNELTDSPCIGGFSTLFDDVCKGCGRTAEEVQTWILLDVEEKRVVWNRLTITRAGGLS